MIIWYIITLLSPLLAYFCWYAKGKGILSLIINIGIIAFMLINCFSIGIWYFYFRNIIYTLIFIVALLVMHDNYRKTAYSLIGGTILVFILRMLIYF
jgi:uncharacterized membrane protein